MRDLRGTRDFTAFLDETTPVDFQFEFDFGHELVVVGVGLQARSIVFITGASSEAIQFVFQKLREYLGV